MINFEKIIKGLEEYVSLLTEGIEDIEKKPKATWKERIERLRMRNERDVKEVELSRMKSSFLQQKEKQAEAIKGFNKEMPFLIMMLKKLKKAKPLRHMQYKDRIKSILHRDKNGYPDDSYRMADLQAAQQIVKG